MSVKVTKAMVLGGTQHTEEVEVPELGGSMTVRPLTAHEYAVFQQKLMRSIRISGEKSITKLAQGVADLREVNLGDFLLHKTEASIYAVSRGIVDDEPWTEEDAGKLPKVVIDKLTDRILEITGVGPSMGEKIKNFPKAPRGKTSSA